MDSIYVIDAFYAKMALKLKNFYFFIARYKGKMEHFLNPLACNGWFQRNLREPTLAWQCMKTKEEKRHLWRTILLHIL